MIFTRSQSLLASSSAPCKVSAWSRKTLPASLYVWRVANTSTHLFVGDCLIVDGHINDSGFYCDGPKCDPETKRTNQENWALMSGDRYHCLECDNVDYCSVCVRGELACKDAGHSLLRIRPTYAKFTPLTEEISIKQRQERAARKACWRCGSEEHTTTDCEAKPVMAKDVDVED